MSFDFSTLITDRSRADLDALRDMLSTPMSDWTAEQLAAFNLGASKGAYNYTDLNRVTQCMDYLNQRLTALGYMTGYQPIIVHPEDRSAGRLPEGYTELNYIQSSGNAYIDTDFKPNQDTRVVMDFQLTEETEEQTPFLTRQAPQQKSFGIFHKSTGWVADYDEERIQVTSDFPITDRINVDFNKNVISINGVSSSFSIKTFTAPSNMCIFARNTNGQISNNCIGKLYSCQIYDNGLLVRDFVPCKTPAGEIGLYDLVNSQFYGNAGTGSFIAGPEVPQPEPEPSLDPYTWYEADTPRAYQMSRYLQNVSNLRGTLTLPEDTVGLPGDMAGLTQEEANNIEIILGVIQAWIENMIQVWNYSGDLYAGEV